MESLFDTHAHLDFEDFKHDFNAVLNRARAAGVDRIITIGSGNGIRSATAAVGIANSHDGIWATVGVHPHDAALDLHFSGTPEAEPPHELLSNWEREVDKAFETLEKLAMEAVVVGIGETGLDYHYDRSPRTIQGRMFERMIELSNRSCKPIVIHSRDADEDTLKILKGRLAPGASGTFHCFSGDMSMARAVLDLGLHISIPGIVTFNSAGTMAEVVRYVPIERMLIETDSPFLAPVPHRGKRNEPAYIVETAKKVAALKGLSPGDVARITSLNAVRLFKIGSEQETDRIAYPIRDSLYLNITNRCTLACIFCAKRRDWSVKGHNLRLTREPEAGEVMACLEPIWKNYREIVFCGYGEPLLRPELVAEVARAMKSRGVAVRVNTDGLANLVHGRDIAEELDGLVDIYSVSLNAPDGKTYAKICPSRHGEAAYEAVKGFILSAKSRAKVVATAVELPGLDVDAARRVAENELGVGFRPRPYNEVG